MNAMPRIDMAKATRLTREGKLKEALALLRGALTQTRPEPARPEPAAPAVDIPPSLFQIPPGDWLYSARGLAKLPGTGRFEALNFANEAGQRTYKLYIPSGYHGQAVPLIVMLHGCTQSPDDFAAGTGMNELAEEQTFLVAYPAQSPGANISKCWNWFNESDQHRDAGEPSLIAGITRQIMSDYNVKSRCVFVAGLSAGGAAAAIMGARYPDLYAAIGVHSGLACGAARNMAGGIAAMQRGGSIADEGLNVHTIPAIVFHGDRDHTVSPVNADQVIEQAKGKALLSADVLEGEANGINYTRTVHMAANGSPVLEQWVLHGAGHAWSGGKPAGSYTDPRGPDASREMARFFMARR